MMKMKMMMMILALSPMPSLSGRRDATSKRTDVEMAVVSRCEVHMFKCDPTRSSAGFHKAQWNDECRSFVRQC